MMSDDSLYEEELQRYGLTFPDAKPLTQSVVQPQEETVLDAAARLVAGSRAADYGAVDESFAVISSLWSTILNSEVTSRQVGLCLIALKLSRYMHSSTRDSLTDICGYARCLEILMEHQS